MNSLVNMQPPTVLRALADHLLDDVRDNEREIQKCETLLNTLRSRKEFLESMVAQCRASDVQLKDSRPVNVAASVVGAIGPKPEVVK